MSFRACLFCFAFSLIAIGFGNFVAISVQDLVFARFCQACSVGKRFTYMFESTRPLRLAALTGADLDNTVLENFPKIIWLSDALRSAGEVLLSRASQRGTGYRRWSWSRSAFLIFVRFRFWKFVPARNAMLAGAPERRERLRAMPRARSARR